MDPTSAFRASASRNATNGKHTPPSTEDALTHPCRKKMNFTTDLPKKNPIVSYIVASAVKCEKFFPGSGKEGPVYRMHAVILKPTLKTGGLVDPNARRPSGNSTNSTSESIGVFK